MKSIEWRTKTTEELHTDLRGLREDLFNMKFKNLLGQLEDHSQIKKTRKDVARILTILRER